MSNYLREQSAGEILRGVLSLYRQNFLVLYLTYLLPTFPFCVMKVELLKSDNSSWLGFWWLLNWGLAAPLATAMLTVGISDICLGNRPSTRRSLRRVFGLIFGKLILTNLMTFAIVALGFLLVVPGIVFIIWWMFVPTIVMLEQTGGWAALKRSRALGKGYYLRNYGVVLLLAILAILLGWLIHFTMQNADARAIRLLGVAVESALAPLPLIATVLIYYELRARSEGYGLTMLGQDLRS